MKIEFFNLGSIKKTEVDFRPLTVIIGPNNSNKTYIAYSLYGLWNALRESHEDAATSKLRMQYTSHNTARIPITDAFLDAIIAQVDREAARFARRLDVYFQDSTSRIFADTKFKIHLTQEMIREYFEKPGDWQNFIANDNGFALSYSERTLSVTARFPKDSETQPHPKINDIRKLANLIKYAIMYFLKRDLFPRPFLLPAERNALVITFKLLTNRRYDSFLNAQRQLLRPGESDSFVLDPASVRANIRYPQPTEDFIKFLMDVDLEKNQRHARGAASSFIGFADTIEESIQNNNKLNLSSTKLGGKEFKIRVNKDLNIDLYNASSSIKQLASLLLYLRYRAAPNDLLIIDEPEMNLHPESQAKLVEILCMLVNCGIRVLITTHSPYVMAHLNNLVRRDFTQDSALDKLAQALYLRDKRAFVRSDQVTACEMREGELKNLFDDDFGIRWDTLSNVASAVQQKYFDILEKEERIADAKS